MWIKIKPLFSQALLGWFLCFFCLFCFHFMCGDDIVRISSLLTFCPSSFLASFCPPLKCTRYLGKPVSNPSDLLDEVWVQFSLLVAIWMHLAGRLLNDQVPVCFFFLLRSFPAVANAWLWIPFQLTSTFRSILLLSYFAEVSPSIPQNCYCLWYAGKIG